MIAGIDLSTKAVEIVRREDGTAEATWQHLALPKHPKLTSEADALSARALRSAWPHGTFWDDVWLCAIEYPFTGGKAGFQAVGLKTIMGACIALIPSHVHVLPLPANLWQGHFIRRGLTLGYDLPLPAGKGERKPLILKRSLELMRAELCTPHPLWTQDAHDAFGISWAAEEINEWAIAASKPAHPSAKPVAT